VGRSHRLLCAVAESDRTFDKQVVRGREAWVGPCIHCRKAIVVPLDAREPPSATLEHIVPRNHGGTDALDNLALSCARCNHQKGRRLDWKRRDDPALAKVIEALGARRRANMRTPPA